jgi:hypothetical protein
MQEKRASELPAVVDMTADTAVDIVAGCGDDQGSNGQDEEDAREDGRPVRYFVLGGWLCKRTRLGADPVANFYLTIEGQLRYEDEDEVVGRAFELLLHFAGHEIPLTVSESEFGTAALSREVVRVYGAGPILYGTSKDLAVAAQEFLREDVRETVISTSAGLDPNGNYLTRDLLITPKRMEQHPDRNLDLSSGRFARNLRLAYPDPEKIVALGEHVYRHFLALKSHAVTYPLAGHICLAPFTSQIHEATGRGLPALHLQGKSGCGKLFLGTLGMSFFGTFDGGVMSWDSTANAIETEGFYFRDNLFLVDDFKLGNISPKVFASVIQKYADGHGRARLQPNRKTDRISAIRGLLLSTGENFLPQVESVSARTLLIAVEPEINAEDGDLCWLNRGEYSSFLPGLIQSVIAAPDWRTSFRDFMGVTTGSFRPEVKGLSNGLRIASNWALNAWGFHQFVRFLVRLGVIDDAVAREMEEEYRAIAIANIREHASRIVQEDPVNVFFEILGERIAAGDVFVNGLPGTLKLGTQIGVAKPRDGAVYIFPDPAVGSVVSHLRGANKRCALTKMSLRDALAGEALIKRVKEGWWTVQVRLADKTRHQAWRIDLEEFKRRSGL